MLQPLYLTRRAHHNHTHRRERETLTLRGEGERPRGAGTYMEVRPCSRDTKLLPRRSNPIEGKPPCQHFKGFPYQPSPTPLTRHLHPLPSPAINRPPPLAAGHHPLTTSHEDMCFGQNQYKVGVLRLQPQNGYSFVVSAELALHKEASH